MPARGWPVSSSAPEFSAQEEQEERAGLSPEERKVIEAELHGTQVFDFQDNETPEQVSMRLRELDECLRSQLLPTLTSAYFEAVEMAPHLVDAETNPIMFLRTEHFDIKKAATRLAMHWKARKALFGADRAFLPMTLNGGALGSSEEDVRQLELGYVIRTPDDQHGRPVIFLDRANLTQDQSYNRNSWLRGMWYLVHVISSRPEYQKSGFVIVINLKDYNPHKSGDRLGAKNMFSYIRDCWCPRLKAFHEMYGSRQSAVRLVEPAVRQMQGRHIRLHFRAHYGFGTDNILSLNDYGVSARQVGPVVGGTFTLDDHILWMKERREIEQQHGKAP
jgi:hypothetical protein